MYLPVAIFCHTVSALLFAALRRASITINREKDESIRQLQEKVDELTQQQQNSFLNTPNTKCGVKRTAAARKSTHRKKRARVETPTPPTTPSPKVSFR